MGDLVDLDKFRRSKEADEEEEATLDELHDVLSQLTQDPEFINAGYTGIYIPLEELGEFSNHEEREDPPEPPVVTRLELLQAAFGHLINALRPWRKK